jgi:hypothetical protein
MRFALDVEAVARLVQVDLHCAQVAIKLPPNAGQDAFRNLAGQLLYETTSPSEQSKDLKKEEIEALATLSVFVGPSHSGLYDEILALVRCGVLSINGKGAMELATEWYVWVDFLILGEMADLWSTKVDPRGKYCVHERVRTDLEKNWFRVSRGWALGESRSKPVFEDDDWGEWRRAFEGKHEVIQAEADGVGKFGI